MGNVESRDGGASALVVRWMEREMKAKTQVVAALSEAALSIDANGHPRYWFFPWTGEEAPSVSEALAVLADEDARS